jgi:hypothetical protein
VHGCIQCNECKGEAFKEARSPDDLDGSRQINGEAISERVLVPSLDNGVRASNGIAASEPARTTRITDDFN